MHYTACNAHTEVTIKITHYLHVCICTHTSNTHRGNSLEVHSHIRLHIKPRHHGDCRRDDWIQHIQTAPQREWHRTGSVPDGDGKKGGIGELCLESSHTSVGLQLYSLQGVKDPLAGGEEGRLGVCVNPGSGRGEDDQARVSLLLLGHVHGVGEGEAHLA